MNGKIALKIKFAKIIFIKPKKYFTNKKFKILNNISINVKKIVFKKLLIKLNQ